MKVELWVYVLVERMETSLVWTWAASLVVLMAHSLGIIQVVSLVDTKVLTTVVY